MPVKASARCFCSCHQTHPTGSNKAQSSSSSIPYRKLAYHGDYEIDDSDGFQTPSNSDESIPVQPGPRSAGSDPCSGWKVKKVIPVKILPSGSLDQDESGGSGDNNGNLPGDHFALRRRRKQKNPFVEEDDMDSWDGEEPEMVQFHLLQSTIRKQELQQKNEIRTEFVREHFTCPICLDVMINSMLISCGHRFCQFCISTWLKSSRKCPVCGKRVATFGSLPQSDVDVAINSVADFLPWEWRQRRKALEENFGHNFFLQSPSPLTRISKQASQTVITAWVHAKDSVGGICRTGSNLLKTVGTTLWRWSKKYWWTGVKVTLAGVILNCLFEAREDIATFLEYMWYLARNFNRKSGVHRRIGKMSRMRIQWEELEKAKAPLENLNENETSSLIGMLYRKVIPK